MPAPLPPAPLTHSLTHSLTHVNLVSSSSSSSGSNSANHVGPSIMMVKTTYPLADYFLWVIPDLFFFSLEYLNTICRRLYSNCGFLASKATAQPTVPYNHCPLFEPIATLRGRYFCSSRCTKELHEIGIPCLPKSINALH